MLFYVMLCYVMLCYVMLCYVMLCYVMLASLNRAVVTYCANALRGRGERSKGTEPVLWPFCHA